MTDQEKVIKGLEEAEIILAQAVNRGGEMSVRGAFNCLNRVSDALALLKAQKPRVITLDEVLKLRFDDVVYLESYPTGAVLSAIVVDVIPNMLDLEMGAVQFMYAGGYNRINNADISYYGKTWRCWTGRPTEEQIEAVKWE